MIELVKKDRPKGIWVDNMKDGDIGVIVAWPYSSYLGRIVQRYESGLITIGIPGRNSWVCSTLPDDCRVRLLEKGEMLVVV